MRCPQAITLACSGLFVVAFAGCGQKQPAADEPTAEVNPTPKPRPAPAPVEDPNPTDPTTPKGAFPFQVPGITDPAPIEPTPMEPMPVEPTPTGVAVAPAPREADPMQEPKPVGPLVVQPDPKLPPPKPEDKKDPPKEGSVIVWPKEVGGRNAQSFIKDMLDADPAIRVVALKTLPAFGPEVKKATTPDGKVTYGQALLARINGQTEKDPWVRLAAFETIAVLGFEEERDGKEAVRMLGIIAEGNPALRAQAVQTLATFGNRGEPSVQYLVGGPVLADPSFETRRSIAAALGLIGTDPKTGPNPRALNCLAGTLINDSSVAVRLEAMQALVMLGPPHHKGMVTDPMDPTKKIEIMVPDTPAAKKYLEAVRKRLAPHTPRPGEAMNPTGVVEPNKQVEIWARVVMMRFDPADEINKENLDGIARYIKEEEVGPKIQALTVLGMLGDAGAKRIDDVVNALLSEDPYVVYTAATSLASMGTAAKPAIPALEQLRTRGKNEDEKKYYTMLADEAIKTIKDPPKSPMPGEK